VKEQVTVNLVETVEVGGEGARLASIRGDDLTLWPAGIGRGPSMTMPFSIWGRMIHEVRMAHMRADAYGYTACEGHNGEDDE